MRTLLIIITIVSIISCRKETTTKVASEVKTPITAQENKKPSQEEINNALAEVFNDQIKMEVDETVFVIDNGTNRANEEMSAGIMKMLASQPYEVFKEKMKAQPKNQNGKTFLGIEEVMLEGKKVLVKKSSIVDEVGDKMIMIMHAFPAGEKTIMISSYYMENEESKYLPLIEKSVVSATLKK